MPTMMTLERCNWLFRLAVEAFVEAGQASSREMTRWNGVVTLADAVGTASKGRS